MSKKESRAKSNSTPIILKWLRENYELKEGVCIPRSALYVHYLDLCKSSDTPPINAASFGKVIRQEFPQITTRRLGTRGQSKYHYYGIAVRKSSIYFESTLSKEEENSPDESVKKEPAYQTVPYSPRTKLGSLLPEFPGVSGMKLPPEIRLELVSTFLVMYRTHCQRILDTVIRASFDEVRHYLLHFWQGMPAHILPVFEYGEMARLVGLCDVILYKAISSVLMPSALQPLPESLGHVISWFSSELNSWLKRALDQLPSCLLDVKLCEAARFSSLVRKQATLNHLAQAAKSVMQASDVTLQMADDWTFLDLDSICRQIAAVTCAEDFNKEFEKYMRLCDEFEKRLDDDVTLEKLTDWLDGLTNTLIAEPSSSNCTDRVGSLIRKFLLTWSAFTSRVMRDLTMNSAPSFGSFHILHLMLGEYVSYKAELIRADASVNATLRYLRGQSYDEELIALNSLRRPESCGFPRSSPWNHESSMQQDAQPSNENSWYTTGSHHIVCDWTKVQNDPLRTESGQSQSVMWQQQDFSEHTHFPRPPYERTCTFQACQIQEPSNTSNQTIAIEDVRHNKSNTYNWHDRDNTLLQHQRVAPQLTHL